MANIQLTTGSDVTAGTLGDDTFDGYAGDDGFGATGGADTLNGLAGDDLFLLNSEYSDVSGLIDGGAGADTVRAYGFDLGSLTFQNVETLSLESFEFGATLSQLNTFDTITSSAPLMTRISLYLLGPGGTIDASTLIDPTRSVEFKAGILSSGYNATGTALADIFKNSNFNDTVHGGLGSDSIFGLNRDDTSGGTDLLFGDGGADSFYLRNQSGTIDGGAGVDTVYAREISGFGGALGDLADAAFVNVERLSNGPHLTFATISQLNSFTTITGGDADKLIRFDQHDGAGGTIDFSAKLKLAAEHIWFRAYGATSAVDVTGTANDDYLSGSAFNDRLVGGDGDDALGGADFVRGAEGRDTLIGGAGDDNYYVDRTDRLIELVGPGGGVDTIIAAATYDLADVTRLQGEFENLTLSGYLGAEDPDSAGYGNGMNNVITGNDGDNRIDGRAGADHMIGRGGDDTYVVDDASDLVEEIDWRNNGTDRVLASTDFDLGDAITVKGFVENLTLTGTASINGFGNELDNRLLGNAGDNQLDGRAGQDKMIGLGGNDIYYVDVSTDLVVEVAGSGIDTVFTTVSYSLAGRAVENMTVIGEDNAKVTGNELANTIVGNNATNSIRGGEGADTLTGAGGRDHFVFESALTAQNADRVTDFTVGEDRIRLNQGIFTELGGPGRLDAEAFAFTTDGTADEADDRIIYDATSGRLFYDADGDGAGAGALFATIGMHINDLSNADFFVV